MIVNIGSVGQPRDRDPRSSYVLFDGEEIIWRRVEYDIETTRSLIKANPNLDDRLGDRLLRPLGSLLRDQRLESGYLSELPWPARFDWGLRH